MSDQEVILRTLARMRRRLGLHYALRDLLLVLGLVVVALLLWRVLEIFAGQAPAATAVAVLAALLLWIAGLFHVLRGRMNARTSLALAAAYADRGAGLKDELKTAYWFIANAQNSPWTAAQIERAAGSARRVDPAGLLPLSLQKRTLTGLAMTLLLLVAVWFVPPLAPSSEAVAHTGTTLSASESRQLHALRELVTQLPEDDAARLKLEQALQSLQGGRASAAEKQRALAAARDILEQRNLEAASAREGLYELAQQMRSNPALEEAALALEEGDARKAAKLLERHAAEAGSGGPRPEMAGDGAEKDKDLKRLLDEARQGAGDPLPGEPTSAAAKEAVDRLNQIAEQLEVQQQLNQASQSLQQLQLAVAQRSALSAGRFSQQAAQNAQPSAQSGQTTMPGGTMYRSAAVARENEKSTEQEGSKTGAAMGEAEAEPLIGKNATPLEVQLKQEMIPNELEDNPQSTGEKWFYAESQEQRSVRELEEVRARSRFAQAQTGTPEGISVRHRQMVKDYFMHRDEGAQ